MKIKRVFFILVLLLSSLSCVLTFGELPKPDLEATVKVKIEQTVQAQVEIVPTEPPVPTPTSVPSPTPTSTPEFSEPQTTSETNQAFSVSVGEDGWQTYTYDDGGFAISLPPDWTHLDLTAEDFDAMMSYASETNPELAGLFSSETIQDLATAGIKMMAVDTSMASLGSSINTNMNVLVEDIPLDLSLEKLVDLNIEQLKNMLGEDIVITRETVDLGNVKSEKIEYELVTNDVYGNSQDVVYEQYMILKDRMQYVISFTTSKENFPGVHELFDKIALSFMLTK